MPLQFCLDEQLLLIAEHALRDHRRCRGNSPEQIKRLAAAQKHLRQIRLGLVEAPKNIPLVFQREA